MSYAVCVKLDQSKILSSGNGLYSCLSVFSILVPLHFQQICQTNNVDKYYLCTKPSHGHLFTKQQNLGQGQIERHLRLQNECSPDDFSVLDSVENIVGKQASTTLLTMFLKGHQMLWEVKYLYLHFTLQTKSDPKNNPAKVFKCHGQSLMLPYLDT